MPPEFTISVQELLAGIGRRELELESLRAYASSLEQQLRSCEAAVEQLVPSETDPRDALPREPEGAPV